MGSICKLAVLQTAGEIGRDVEQLGHYKGEALTRPSGTSGLRGDSVFTSRVLSPDRS